MHDWFHGYAAASAPQPPFANCFLAAVVVVASASPLSRLQFDWTVGTVEPPGVVAVAFVVVAFAVRAAFVVPFVVPFVSCAVAPSNPIRPSRHSLPKAEWKTPWRRLSSPLHALHDSFRGDDLDVADAVAGAVAWPDVDSDDRSIVPVHTPAPMPWSRESPE
jgi:hypothetical protein